MCAVRLRPLDHVFFLTDDGEASCLITEAGGKDAMSP